MEVGRMRRFWDARAREDAFHFVDNRQPYKAADPERFWREGERDLDTLLSTVGVTVRQHVVVLDLSPEMLRRAHEHNDSWNNLPWLPGAGRSPAGSEHASVDGAASHVGFQPIPDRRVTLGYVEELGRVLKRGAWAAFGVS